MTAEEATTRPRFEPLSAELRFPDRTIDRHELALSVDTFADELRDWDGELVIVGAENESTTAVAWIGAMAAGHRVLLANPDLPPAALSRFSSDAAEVCLVGTGPWLAAHDSDAATRSLRFSDLEASGERMGSVRTSWDMPGSTLLLTSGTTGGSKAVEWTWSALEHSAKTMAMVGRYRPTDVLVTSLPLFHANALLVVLLAGMIVGANVGVGRKFSATSFSSDMQVLKGSKTSLLGSMAQLILERDRSPHVEIERMILAPCDPELADALRARYGCSVAQIYGQTDIGICLWNDEVTEDAPGCGQPLPGWEAALAETGGGEGELLIRSTKPGIAATGYYGDPELTLRTRRDFWFHTGDVFSFAGNDYVFRGRMKDVVRTRGENVHCGEVEAVIRRTEGVRDVAVVGRDNELGEQDVIAVLETDVATDEVLERIRAEVTDHLPPYARPVGVAVVDALPRTPTEKVVKSRIDLSKLDIREPPWTDPQQQRRSASTKA